MQYINQQSPTHNVNVKYNFKFDYCVQLLWQAEATVKYLWLQKSRLSSCGQCSSEFILS